jgi:hypothetical protein
MAIKYERSKTAASNSPTPKLVFWKIWSAVPVPESGETELIAYFHAVFAPMFAAIAQGAQASQSLFI